MRLYCSPILAWNLISLTTLFTLYIPLHSRVFVAANRRRTFNISNEPEVLNNTSDRNFSKAIASIMLLRLVVKRRIN